MRTCLVVDDNPNNRLVARYIMEDLGFTITESDSADEAAAILIEQTFDVIMLDWMMPQMDGIDFLTRMRQDPRNENLKIIMCTAKEGESNIQTAIHAGANAFLAKPITFDSAQKTLKDIGVL
jgi:two-component system chemotaxis response regulator CheY